MSAKATTGWMVAALALTALNLAGCCCKGCGGGAIAKAVKGPPEAEVERQVRERLSKDATLAQKLCGVPSRGLTNIVIKHPALEKSLGVVEVQANTAEGHKAKDSAGKPDPAKMLLCTASLQVFWQSTEGPSGTTWTIKSISISTVSTPGVDYKPPRSHHWG